MSLLSILVYYTIYNFIKFWSVHKYTHFKLILKLTLSITCFIGTLAKIDTHKLRKLEDLNLMLFPRLLVYAERAWHKSQWEQNLTSMYYTERYPFNINGTQLEIEEEEYPVLGCISAKELPKLAKNHNVISYVEAPGAR